MPGCLNCHYKSPKVGTKGPEDSPFVIVGESPGINEVVKGLPFVGDSGSLLEQSLQKAGIDSCSVKPYYTNAIQCLPRRKEPANLAAACQSCHSRLIDELKAHPRKIILALGNGALWSLTNNYDLKITKERGKLISSPLAELGILFAVHPAFLLRGGGNYTQFQNDINYAVQLANQGKQAYKLPDGTSYDVLETEEDLKEFVDYLANLPKNTLVASDIETTGFNYQEDKILCLGIQHAPKRSTIIPHELISPQIFRAGEHLNWTWHNGKFDCRFLRHHLYFNDKSTTARSEVRVDNDTMLMSYTINERRGIHDLDQVSKDWLGSANHKNLVAEYYKGHVIDPTTGKKRRRNLSDAPPELVHEYLARDINDTYKLYAPLKEKIDNDKNLSKFYYKHLIPAGSYLLKVELNGLLVDDSWVMSNHERLSELMIKYEKEINQISTEILGYETNPRSPKQLQNLLYGKQGLHLAPISWSTDDDSLEKLKAINNHPIIKSLQNYREVQKAHGTYVKPLMHSDMRELISSKKATVVFPDNRVHQTYLLHGTQTGRLSCADMNVQNIPRDPHLRGQFIARPGYGILECDYSQAELRCLAALSKCPDLLEIFRSGKDLHNEVSTFLFGPNFTREEKMAAKTVNFGIVYGRTAPSIASDPALNAKMDITVEEAQRWIDGWADRFPGAWAFIQKCRAAPLRNQTLVTIFGNKKRPGVVTADKLNDLQNESANFFHQATASHLTVRAGIELFDTLEWEYDTHIANTVHDCIVAEVPLDADHIQATAKYICSVMESIPMSFPALAIVPWKAEPEFGLHWGNLLKFKELNAEPYNWDISKIPEYIAPH